MIKLESIIKNDNKKNNDNSPFTLFIDKEKFNYIYSNKQQDIDDVFSIMSGFYQTRLGHIIYDDFNFNEMSLSKRSLFIKNNLEIISQFSNLDRNKTVYYLIKRHMIFCDLLFKNYDEKILKLLDTFDLKELKEEKLKDLSSDKILSLHILLASIKKPKYVFIYNFEKYISNDIDITFIIKNFKEHLPSDATFIFFSTKDILEKKYFDFFDLTKTTSLKNNILLVRNKKFISDKKFSKNSFNIIKQIV